MKWAYGKLPDIFAPYKFEVQKLITNHPSLQTEIDNAQNSRSEDNTTLFGICWDKRKDMPALSPFHLI